MPKGPQTVGSRYNERRNYTFLPKAEMKRVPSGVLFNKQEDSKDQLQGAGGALRADRRSME